MSGVVMTRTHALGAPYCVVNFDDATDRTDVVTAGGDARTVVCLRGAELRPDLPGRDRAGALGGAEDRGPRRPRLARHRVRGDPRRRGPHPPGASDRPQRADDPDRRRRDRPCGAPARRRRCASASAPGPTLLGAHHALQRHDRLEPGRDRRHHAARARAVAVPVPGDRRRLGPPARRVRLPRRPAVPAARRARRPPVRRRPRLLQLVRARRARRRPRAAGSSSTSSRCSPPTRPGTTRSSSTCSSRASTRRSSAAPTSCAPPASAPATSTRCGTRCATSPSAAFARLAADLAELDALRAEIATGVAPAAPDRRRRAPPRAGAAAGHAGVRPPRAAAAFVATSMVRGLVAAGAVDRRAGRRVPRHHRDRVRPAAGRRGRGAGRARSTGPTSSTGTATCGPAPTTSPRRGTRPRPRSTCARWWTRPTAPRRRPDVRLDRRRARRDRRRARGARTSRSTSTGSTGSCGPRSPAARTASSCSPAALSDALEALADVRRRRSASTARTSPTCASRTCCGHATGSPIRVGSCSGGSRRGSRSTS